MSEVVEIKIIEDGGYAFWGTYKKNIVFIHITELSRTRPIPQESIPKVGQVIKAKIFKEIKPDEPVPLDVSQNGKYEVRYAASPALLEGEVE